jgi:hypothetical protein
MVTHPSLAVEVAANHRGALLSRQREHEVRQRSFAASDERGAQHPVQEAPQRQRMMRQLEVPMRSGNDPRAHAERLLELLGVQLEVETVLVGDTKPIAREAAIGDDVPEQLVEGDALIDSEPVSVLDIVELGRKAELRGQSADHAGTQRAAERSRLQNVAKMRSGNPYPSRQLLIGQSGTQIRRPEERLARRGDLGDIVVELEDRLLLVVRLQCLRER